jgi:Spy/CpxP family protein refolding chaperone
MKIKLALLLALITSAGLLAQDAPKPDAPKGDAPAKKGEGKGDKGGKKQQGPQRPESVDEATWKKFGEAMKAAQKDEAVVAAKAKAADAKTPEEKQAAGKGVMEATKAAILKADASLESVFKAIEEARAKGKGKGDKGGKGGKKPEGDKGGKKPEAK